MRTHLFRRWAIGVALVALSSGCSDSGGSNQGNTANTKPGSGGASACREGAERCHCYGNGTCDDGLTCASNFCVVAPGGGGASGGVDSGAPGAGGTVGSGGADGVGGSSSGGFSFVYSCCH